MFPDPQELNLSSCTCYIYCLSWWKSNWILPFNKASLHTTPQRLPQRWHYQYVPEWSAVPCILNSKRRVFDIFTSLEYIVEEQLGQPISLLGNRLSEFLLHSHLQNSHYQFELHHLCRVLSRGLGPSSGSSSVSTSLRFRIHEEYVLY